MSPALRALAILLTVGVGALLATYGPGEEGARQVIRWTARGSLGLLCLALAGEGLKGSFVGWRHRAFLLRGLALSHGLHLVAILALAGLTAGQNLWDRASVLNVVGGLLAYVFIAWGALRPHSPVASYGLFWIWIVFLHGYGTRAWRMPWPYGIAVALLALVMLVRVRGYASLADDHSLDRDRPPDALIAVLKARSALLEPVPEQPAQAKFKDP